MRSIAIGRRMIGPRPRRDSFGYRFTPVNGMVFGTPNDEAFTEAVAAYNQAASSLVESDARRSAAEREALAMENVAGIEGASRRDVAGIGADAQRYMADQDAWARAMDAQLRAAAAQYGTDAERQIARENAAIQRAVAQLRADADVRIGLRDATAREKAAELGAEAQKASAFRGAEAQERAASTDAAVRQMLGELGASSQERLTGMTLGSQERMGKAERESRERLGVMSAMSDWERALLGEEGATDRAALQAMMSELASSRDAATRMALGNLEAKTQRYGIDTTAGTAKESHALQRELGELQAGTQRYTAEMGALPAWLERGWNVPIQRGALPSSARLLATPKALTKKSMICSCRPSRSTTSRKTPASACARATALRSACGSRKG